MRDFRARGAGAFIVGVVETISICGALRDRHVACSERAKKWDPRRHLGA